MAFFFFFEICASVAFAEELEFKQNLLTSLSSFFIFIFYSYIVATYSFMLTFRALSIQKHEGKKKKKKESKTASDSASS